MPFELKTSSGIVNLVWDTWAMLQFAYLNSRKKDKEGNPIPITVNELMEIYSSDNLTLKHIVTLLQAGADSAGTKVDEKTACKWVDECGGLSSTNSQILSYIQYTIREMLPRIPEDNKPQEEEKKS